MIGKVGIRFGGNLEIGEVVKFFYLVGIKAGREFFIGIIQFDVVFVCWCIYQNIQEVYYVIVIEVIFCVVFIYVLVKVGVVGGYVEFWCEVVGG